eukprot:TRINITY_DN40357_c0_g1_i1.p1 TRINITY_DN40357_c0_g1~~TRINITY_DN40357_c0_g1_i1.p1  ORF type:complete len:181 (+),score=31.81 TRINITY_DN40357_c0_g1_i1:2-544(+)
MTVAASGLLACLKSIKATEKLRVLALSGLRVDGGLDETAALLRVLPQFTGLAAVALRFSVPQTFASLLPVRALFELRCAWPLLRYFALGDMSLHGFDYWPSQITDFREHYEHGKEPTPYEVFENEFRGVLSTQYGLSVEKQWEQMSPTQRNLWAEVAQWLPRMPHSELRQRATELFPGGL